MSWDVLLLDAPIDVVSTGQFPGDFSSNLGSRDHVLAEITGLLPDLDLGTPGWGFLCRDGYYMEIDFGDADPVPYIALHIRGSENCISALKSICEHTGWKAFDMTTGGFIQFDSDPAAGFRKWKTARDEYEAGLIEKKKSQEGQ